MFTELPITRFRAQLRPWLDHQPASGDRLVLTRHGQPIGALVSMKDFNALEEVERNREEFLEERHAERMREFRALKAGRL